MKYTYEQLIEKMIRAKIKLEATHRSHNASCPVEDPESYAPCNCGASNYNLQVQSAIADLDI